MMGQLTQLELLFHALFAGGSESSTAETFAPVLRSESSRVQKFSGAKVPSLPGPNDLGSEKSSYQFKDISAVQSLQATD